MRPIIGVTTSLSDDENLMQLNRTYTSALFSAGALPVLLPVTTDPDVIADYASRFDGLLLTGGDDVDPHRFGALQTWACGTVHPLRDEFEIALCCEFVRLRKPILGICRGIQLMNAAFGGTLYQDLQSEVCGCIAHRQKQLSHYASHPVRLAEGSQLARIYGIPDVTVNSLHHQAIKNVAFDLHVAATAPDSVIEGIEHATLPFCIGVQWHPERLWDQDATAMHAKLFKAFVDACRTA